MFAEEISHNDTDTASKTEVRRLKFDNTELRQINENLIEMDDSASD